ncbi:MAG: hypothetical protein RL338_1331 [Chloroflexota bacterium]
MLARPCATIRAMTGRGDPLEGIERVLVDGNNLLGALRRAGAAAPVPAGALVGRLRAALPATVRIELVFDGPPDPGSGGVRVASGVTVRYSGRLTADALLVRLAAEAAPFQPGGAAAILVVSDDTALGAELRRHGAIVAGTAWLIGRLGRTQAGGPGVGNRRDASIGNGRPPRSGPAGGAGGRVAGPDEPEDERSGWRPGRGATAKRGNAKRAPRARGGEPPNRPRR